METPEEIIELAASRIEEALILFHAGKYDGAYYLSGYSVELSLKAKICERYGIPNLFSNDENKIVKLGRIGEVRQALRTHNLLALLVFSGLKAQFDIDKAEEKSLSLSSSTFFINWSEKLRYRPCGSISVTECKESLDLLISEKGILKWIKEN